MNNTDPFGLCPPEKGLCQWLKAGLIAAGTDLGGVAGGGGGLFAGPVAPIASPLAAIEGMAIGSALGGIAGDFIDHAFFSDRGEKEKGQQFDEISKRQRQVRKQGQGDRINSIEKSRQRDKQELRDEAERALEEIKKGRP